MNNRLIIMQGKPACGKSTIAEAIRDQYFQKYTTEGPVIVSADNYLIEGSEYVYSYDRAIRAHSACEAATELLMQDESPLIIIDNTNIKFDWAESYIKLANEYNYDIQTIRVEATWDLQNAQNNLRSEDRKVPLEHYRHVIMEDLLCESLKLSFSERLSAVWSLVYRLFLSRPGKIRTNSYIDTVLWKK